MESLIEMYLHHSPRSINDSILKAQFQQKQLQEKEQKLLQMLDNQQQRGLQKAGLSGVIPPKYGGGMAGTKNGGSAGTGPWSNHSSNSTTPTPSRTSPTVNNPIQTNPGKVRQMFEERRKGGPSLNGASNSTGFRAGIDKSYPLDPIVIDGSKTNLGSKKRSLSSKSDPPLPPNTHSRVGLVKAAPPKPAARTQPQRLTPTPPPLNLGSRTREASLGRRSPGDSLPPPRQPSGRSTLGLSRRGSSSGTGTPPDENGNDLRSGNPLPPIPTSTKYRDYVNGIESSNTSLGERESQLGSKMKNLSLSPSKDLEVNAYAVEIRSSDSRNSGKSGMNGRKPPVGKTVSKTNGSVKPSKVGSTSKAGSSSSSAVERSPPGPGMEECRICHRHFANDRIEKHETICKKTATKKRKVFDPTKMRMQGTEAEPYLRTVSAKTKKAAAPAPAAAAAAKKGDWRKKHEEFINAIRAAKEYSNYVAKGGNPADLPPPVPSENADYVQCPHCGRKFNAGAAERHIPKCQNIKSNKR